MTDPPSRSSGRRSPPSALEGASGKTDRNPGIPLDLDWLESVRVNRSAVEWRIATLGTGRALQKEWRAGWLLRAIALMDLTTLSGDDTPGVVRSLCARARHPIRSDVVEALHIEPLQITTAAICVYHAFVPTAIEVLDGSGIPVAAVSAGFPHGLSPLRIRIAEVEGSVAAGAAEIDVVIRRSHALTSDWSALYHEVRAFREACGAAHLKVILATGELGTLTRVARASLVCMMAGADFIKTSTGKESVNATRPVGLVMARQIRDFRERTSFAVGLKAAGGIRRASEALDWLILVREELGRRWLEPDRFRLGASSLLGDIERQLEEHATARDPVTHHHP